MTQSVRTPRRNTDPRPRPAARKRPGRGQSSLLAAFGWRWLSLLLMLLSVGSVVFVFINPIFYVTNAEVGGLRYVPADEIYSSSGIANQHILFIDPEQVRQNLLVSPSLSSAQVGIEWPARVVIVVREREPALVWEQGGERYWVDVNGNLMALRTEIKELVRVVNEGANIPFHCPGPDCPEGQGSAITIDPAVILGAQQLKTLRANIEVLYYDPVHGLSYQDGRGWRAFFGTGTNMDVKLLVYESLVENLIVRGITPTRVDVSNPDAPYYGTR